MNSYFTPFAAFGYSIKRLLHLYSVFQSTLTVTRLFHGSVPVRTSSAGIVRVSSSPSPERMTVPFTLLHFWLSQITVAPSRIVTVALLSLMDFPIPFVMRQTMLTSPFSVSGYCGSGPYPASFMVPPFYRASAPQCGKKAPEKHYSPSADRLSSAAAG